MTGEEIDAADFEETRQMVYSVPDAMLIPCDVTVGDPTSEEPDECYLIKIKRKHQPAGREEGDWVRMLERTETLFRELGFDSVLSRHKQGRDAIDNEPFAEWTLYLVKDRERRVKG